MTTLQELRTLSDEELVTLCVERKGIDDRPFAELFHRHLPLVRSICRRYMGDDPQVDDLCQQVFLKIHRSLAKFDGRSRLTTWIYRVTLNACHNEARRRRRRPHEHQASVDLEEAWSLRDASPRPDEALSRESDLETLLEAMKTLRPAEREVLEMAELQGATYAEISARLGIGLSATKMRAHRARIALRSAYTRAKKRTS